MMRYSVFFSIFFLVSAFSFTQSFGQSSVGKKLLMRPKDYYNPIGYIASDKSKPLPNELSNIWIVFSDRDNNPTYTASNGQKTSGKSMKFGDPFFVIGDEGNFVHIVRFDNTNGIYSTPDYKLTKDLEDFGWARKTDLLLWNKCLEDSTTKFSIKALTVTKPESLTRITEYVKGKNLKLFNSPIITSGNENSKDVRIFEFLYVFKEDAKNNSCLVGTSDIILKSRSADAKNLLLGWVSKDVITEWKNRVTLEWNSDPAAVEERKSKNIKLSIANSESGALQYKSSGAVPKEAMLNDADDYLTEREPPTRPRLPFFPSKSSSEVVKTGYETGIIDLTGHEVVSAKEYAGMLKKAEEALEQARFINVIFVVDGSDVMKTYQSAIQQIIASTANRLKDMKMMRGSGEGQEKFEYKIGAVAYRDYTDKDCQQGGITDIQFKKMTSNYEDIVAFFQNDVQFAKCKGTENRRALFMALKKATDLLDGKEQQTNLIVVLGAGANRENDKAIKVVEVVNQLANYNCPVFAFQVKFPSVPQHEAYDDFQTQFRKIILDVAKDRRDRHNKEFPANPSPGTVNIDRDDSIPNLYKLNSPKFSPIPGAFMFSDELNAIEPKQLTTVFLKMLEEFQTEQEKIQEEVENQFKGQGEREVMDEGVMNFFTKIKVDPSLLKKASYTNIQLFVEGYTPITCDMLKYPLYNYSVFVDAGELEFLISDLKKISEGSEDKSTRRLKIQNAFIDLLAFRIGPKEAKNKIKTQDVEQILAQISGRITRQESIFNKVKVSEITDPKKVKDDILDQLTQTIQDKLVGLEDYSKQSDTYFTSNSVRYYWVPESMLP